MRLPWRCSDAVIQSRCLSSEVLAGAGGPTSKMAHSAGCWQEASVPHSRYLRPHRRAAHDIAVNFPQSQQPERQEGSQNAFYDQVSEETHCHFHSILFIRNESLSPAHTEGKGNEAPPPRGAAPSQRGSLCHPPLLGSEEHENH